MRAVWVDEGNDPNWDKLARHQITWAFVSLNDPQVRRRVQAVRDRGLVAGVYSAWSWYPGMSGPEFAQSVHSRLADLFPDATPTWPRVQLNDETHDPDRIESMLRRWRQVRPYTATSWTLEGMQGGWATHPPLVKACVDLRIRVVPQAYSGNMSPWDPLAVVRNLTRNGKGYPDSLVTPFQDAASLRPWWDGFAFTMGRLP